jgi:hypothetical protein
MSIAGAVLLAAIAVALHMKHRVPRIVAWLLFLVGVGAAATITGLVGGFSGISLFGVGVFTVGAIVTAIFFWEEAVRSNGLHRVRTPLIALAFGVCLMSAGGAFFAALQNVVDKTGSSIDNTVQANLNGSK